GEYPTPEDAAWLAAEHGVTVVVSLQDDADLACKGLVLSALENAYRTHGLGFHRIPVPDGDDRHLAARLGDLVAPLDRLPHAGEVEDERRGRGRHVRGMVGRLGVATIPCRRVSGCIVPAAPVQHGPGGEDRAWPLSALRHGGTALALPCAREDRRMITTSMDI